MRKIFAIFCFAFLSFQLDGQVVFTFECACKYLTAADSNCDVCSATVQSRLFKGLLVRRNGTAYKWIESPYVVRFEDSTAIIQELVYPNPEKLIIGIEGTNFDSVPQFRDSLWCPCNEAFPDSGWVVSDSLNFRRIISDTLYFVGSGVTTVELDSANHTVTIYTPAGSADGSETIVQDSTGIQVFGSGTSADPYVILNTGDTSNTNELQTLTWVQSTGVLSISSGNSVTILNMAGATSSVAGEKGLVPKPVAGDEGKFLRGDGTWANPSVGGDNWGSQVVQHGSTLTGNGTGGSPLDVATDGITATHIATGAVGTSEVADNTLTATDLAVNVVSSVDGVTNDGGDIDLIAGGIVTITPNDGANTITISATEVDGSTTNEVLTISDGTDSEALGGQTLTVSGTGIATVDYVPATNTLTIGAVEVDGSTSNELQTISASGAGPASYNVDLSNSGGSVTFSEGAGIDLTRSVNTLTITNTGDVSNTNELQTLSVATNTTTLSNGGGSMTIAGAGINTVSTSGSTITVTGTEVDGSISNELQTLSVATNTTTLSNGGGSMTIAGSGIIGVSTSGTTITVTATEVDGSTTNELQTISASGSGPTSYNIDMSNGGGSITFAEGSGVDLTRSVNTITIAALDASATNELQTLSVATNTTTLSNGGGSMTIAGAGINTVSTSGSTITVTGTEVDGSVTNEGLLGVGAGAANTSVVTSNTSGAVGVTIQVGGINTITETTSANGGTIVITATEVDGSTSNELQTLSVATNTTTLSAGGGSMTIAGAGTNTVSTSGSTITVTGTEVDGSVTNEVLTISDGTDSEALGGQTLTVSGSGIATVDYVPATNTLTIGAVEVDGSVTNEGLLGVGVGGANTSVITSNTSGAVGVTIQVGGINTISETTSANGGTIVITGTEVDGSVTNELQTLSVATNTTTLSAGGGSMTIAGAGINTVSTSGSTITVTGTEVDGSVSNENLTISDGTDSENLGGQTLTVSGTGIATVDYVPATNTLNIGAIEVDGSTSNELQTISASGVGPTSYNVDLSNSGGSVVLAEGAGVDLTRSVNTITIAALDASATNELQTLSVATNTTTLSNGGGSMTIAGAGINTVSTSGSTITVTGTEVDGSVTNELQTLSVATNTTTLSNGGGSMTIAGAGINTVSTSGSTITVTGTEVDGSVTNEGLLGVGAGAANTSVVTSSTSGAVGVTIQVGGINTITETTSANGGTIVITGTEVDGSTSNELQTLSVATNTTTLSAGGGSMTIAGAGINTVSTSGSTITVTGTEVDGSVSNENLTISDGTDSENLGGQTLTVSGTGIATVDYVPATNTLTVGAVEVDGSTSNELQTLSVATNTTTLSAGGGSMTIAGAGTNTVSTSGSTITVTGTEIDGSVTNELQTISAGGAGPTNYTVDLSNGGGSITFAEGAGIDLARSVNTLTITNTGDLSSSNELQTLSVATNTTTLSAGGGSMTIAGAGINTVSTTGSTITVNGTEVDGSVTNEGLLGVSAGASNTSVVTSNTSGAVGVTIQVGGINTITETTSANGGTIVITGTEVDGSVTNELQTYSHSGTTSYTNTLSGSGGAFTLQGSGSITISHSAGTVTIGGGGSKWTDGTGGAIYRASKVGIGSAITTPVGTVDIDAGSSFVPLPMNFYGTSSSASVVYGQLSNLSTNGTTFFSLNQEANINSIRAGLRKYGTTHSTRAGELELTNIGSFPVTISTNDVVRVTVANTGTVTIPNLSGTGTQLVAANASGTLVRTSVASAGLLDGAENGLQVVGTKAQQGGTFINTTTLDQNSFQVSYKDGRFAHSRYNNAITNVLSALEVEGIGANPNNVAGPTEDGVFTVKGYNNAGATQYANSLTMGVFTTATEGVWLQSRSQAVQNTYYPIKLNPRGGRLSVGKLTGLQALVTLSATTWTGTGIDGSVLHLENSEGNGKVACSYTTTGSSVVDAETTWWDATDAFRIVNRNTNNINPAWSTIRFAIGGETADKAILALSTSTAGVRFGVGHSSPVTMHSTLQTAGSFAGPVIHTGAASLTLGEDNWKIGYTGSAATSYTLPTASTVGGREYWIYHIGTGGTITLSATVTKSNGVTFNTITAGQFAHIWSDGTGWFGYKVSSL